MNNNPIKYDAHTKDIYLDLNSKNGVFICPFFPTIGFSDRGFKEGYSEKLYNSIIDGKTPVIMQWLGAHQKVNMIREWRFTNKTPFDSVNLLWDIFNALLDENWIWKKDADGNLLDQSGNITTDRNSCYYNKNQSQLYQEIEDRYEARKDEINETDILDFNWWKKWVPDEKTASKEKIVWNTIITIKLNPTNQDLYIGMFMRWLTNRDFIILPDTKMEKDVTVGEFFLARVIDANYDTTFNEKTAGFINAGGENLSYQEQSIEKRITVTTQNKFFLEKDETGKYVPKSNLIRLFFVIPQVSEYDLLFIENLEVVIKDNGDYHHTIITFLSLGERLNNIGQTLDSVIQFSNPGDNPVLPQVQFVEKFYQTNPLKPFYTGKDGIRYDFNDKNFRESAFKIFSPNPVWSKRSKFWTRKLSIEKTKELTVDINLDIYKNKLNNAKYIQFDFLDNVVALNSIMFLGREVGTVFNAEKGIGSDTLNPIKPLFLHNISSPIQQTTTNTGESLISIFNGSLEYELWNTQNEEWQYYFDPTKTRNSSGIIDGIDGDELKNSHKTYFNIQQNNTISRDTVGYQKLSIEALSDYILNPIQQRDQSIKVNSDKRRFQGTMSDFLATQWLVNKNQNYLEYGIKKITNYKQTTEEITTASVDWLGKIGGALLGMGATKNAVSALGSSKVGKGATGGFLGGNIAKDVASTVFRFIPDSIFNQTTQYIDGTRTSFLIPTNFLKQLWHKLEKGADSKIPLALLGRGQDNFLSGLADGSQHLFSFSAELTDTINYANQTSNNTFDTIDLVWGKYKVDKIRTVATNKTFSLDFLNLKGIINTPCRITVFNADYIPIWTHLFAPQSLYTGIFKDWSTNLLLSNYHFENLESYDRYRKPAGLKLADREVEMAEIYTGAELEKNITQRQIWHFKETISKSKNSEFKYLFTVLGDTSDSIDFTLFNADDYQWKIVLSNTDKKFIKDNCIRNSSTKITASQLTSDNKYIEKLIELGYKPKVDLTLNFGAKIENTAYGLLGIPINTSYWNTFNKKGKVELQKKVNENLYIADFNSYIYDRWNELYYFETLWASKNSLGLEFNPTTSTILIKDSLDIKLTGRSVITTKNGFYYRQIPLPIVFTMEK